MTATSAVWPRDEETDRSAGRRSWFVAVMLVAVLVIAALTAAGCTASASPQAVDCGPHVTRTGNNLIVEGDPWSGYAPFRPAGNLLPGRLSYVEELDQAQRACDLTTGKADFAVTTIGQYLKNKPDGVIVGVIDQSQGADALVLNTHDHPYLTSVDWLPKLVADDGKVGKKPVLAYTGNSPSEELMDELSNTFEEFKPSQFDLVSVDQSASALAMLDTHEADLAIVWEPDTTTAGKAGNIVAYSSRDVPNSIVDVIVASRSIVRRDPAAVQQLLDAYYGFMDDKLAHPAALASFIAEDGNLTPDAAGSVIAGIKLYGSTDGNAFMNDNLFPLDEPQVRLSIRAIGSLLALTDPSLTLSDDMVDGQFMAHVPAGKAAK